jgi:hypothetical protein
MLGAGLALATVMGVAWTALAADEAAMKLRGVIVGANDAPLTFELQRWSTDAERAPFAAALVPLPPATAPAPAAAAGGRGGRGAAAGRGGRGAAPPPSPEARLTTEVKAAPTIGFVWGDGPTGYSIKYAWRASTPDGRERLVLVTDRRLGTHLASPSAGPAKAVDAEFTVIEMRLDAKGGEGKTSLDSPVVVDSAAATLALGAYTTAPIFIKVTR